MTLIPCYYWLKDEEHFQRQKVVNPEYLALTYLPPQKRIKGSEDLVDLQKLTD